MRLLIVNADDYGLTAGVCRGVLTAHRDGIVTSTSVLAVAPAFDAWAPALRDTGGIGVGAHLAVVGEDPPLLSASEIPTLVDRRGRFALSWRQFLPRAARRAVNPDDVRREFTAQLARLQGAGLRITHIDSHQHLHMWPMVGRVVVDLAVRNGIGALRVTRSAARSAVGVTIRRLAAGLVRMADAAGLRYAAVATGLDEAGTLEGPRLTAAITRLGATGALTAELGAHPGEPSDPDLARYQWGYRWDGELAALTSPEARAAVERAGFRLGHFGDL